MSGSIAGDWLDDTHWYVATAYLLALLAINTSAPRIITVDDQTIWHIDDYTGGYITGISVTPSATCKAPSSMSASVRHASEP